MFIRKKSPLYYKVPTDTTCLICVKEKNKIQKADATDAMGNLKNNSC